MPNNEVITVASSTTQNEFISDNRALTRRKGVSMVASSEDYLNYLLIRQSEADVCGSKGGHAFERVLVVSRRGKSGFEAWTG